MTKEKGDRGEAHLVYDLAHDEIIMEGWIRVRRSKREERIEKRKGRSLKVIRVGVGGEMGKR
jgi:hypothetical protein